MNTTHCEKCIFYSIDDWCEFGIPESITNPKIMIDNTNHTISEYNCLYAFGIETLEKNKESVDKNTIKKIILDKNQIAYTLILNFDTINQSIRSIIEMVNDFCFKPKNLICFGKTIEGDMVAAFEKYLSIPWKANKILPHIDERISIISSVDPVIDANNSTSFLYISEPETYLSLENLLNNIHIDSVINQSHGIRLSSLSSLDGLFMTYDTYRILGSDKPKFFYDTEKFFKDNPNCPYLLHK